MDYRSGDVRTGDRAILMLQLTRLHDALELDLPNVPGLANQADVHDLAADLKAEMEGAADPGKLRRIVERASFYASKIGEAMRYTKEVVDGFSGIHW